MSLSNIPISSLLSGVVSAGVALIRVLQDKSPQRGLRYSDLEVRPDDLLAYKITPDGENGSRSGQFKKRTYTHFVRVTNYGREVIDQKDYLRPFSVRYDDAVEVLGYRIIHDEWNIQPRIYESGASGIQISETLNPGDAFTLGVLLTSTSNPDKPVIDCRIKGIRHLKGHLRGKNWLEILWHSTVHYWAIPLSVLGGLVIGYCVFLALTLGYSMVASLSLVVKDFGPSLLAGFLIGGLLVTGVEFEQFYSFRRHRRFAEDTFRAAAKGSLEKPLPESILKQ